MMSLHSSKRLALINLTNCMTNCNVKTIKQLSDGKIISSIIETAFSEVTPIEQKQTFPVLEHSKDEDKPKDQDSNLSGNDSQKELNSVVESNEETKSEQIFIEEQNVISSAADKSSPAINGDECIATNVDFANINMSDKFEYIDVISSANDESSPIKSVDVKDEDLSKRYEFIECFIDEKYNLKSKRLITYGECQAENEFELAKVILFVLSEVVQHYVRLKNVVIQTLSHLDLKVQQDLEDCFNLFINKRSKITEASIIKLLSNPASYKVSPVKNSFVTPKRSCSSKYKRSPSPSLSPLQESVYKDSPLKTYFESPIFTKKDIITKEKEILKTRQNLYEEEIKSNTLQLEMKKLEKELKHKNKEIISLKTRIKEFQETEKSEDCENCAILGNSLKEKERKLRETESSMKERYEMLAVDYEDKLENYKVKISESLSSCNFEAKQAEIRCEKLEAELDDVKFQLLKREQYIRYLAENLEEKTKECEITKEKLSAALVEKEKMPEYSINGECLGGVIEKEHEELKLIALSKVKAMADAMVQCTENSFDCKVMENSIDSKNKLPPKVNSCEISMMTEENIKECPNVCDNNEQYSPISLTSKSPTDAFPFTLSNSRNDTVGALWQQYNDSMTENENTNEVCVLEKCINNLLRSLHKFENEFIVQNKKCIKITSRANGSNGLVSSPVMNELIKDLKSIKNSLLCLSQVVEKSDVNIQNNNTISKSSEVINGKECNSNIAVNSTCDTCLKKTEELANSVSSVIKDSEALQEKIKEFDILKEQYLAIVALLRQKEKDLSDYKMKFILEKKENIQNVKILREFKIKYQKLQQELKDLKKTESNLKKDIKTQKFLFKEDVKDMKKRYAILFQKYFNQQVDMNNLKEKNQKLEKDIVSYRTQSEKLIDRANYLEKRCKELSSFIKCEPEQSTNIELETRTISPGPMENAAQQIPEEDPLTPIEGEISSCNTDENITASALYTRNLQNPFQLHTADEESFLNHSSIAGLSRNYESEDSLNRLQELNRRNTLSMPRRESYNSIYNSEEIVPNRLVELSRRNTLCMPHLRSCYPAEGMPLNLPNQHSSNYVDFVTHDVTETDSESRNKVPPGKKRKVCETNTEDQSSDVVKTPSRRMKFKTPQSLHKLLKLTGRRNRCSIIKPKPE